MSDEPENLVLRMLRRMDDKMDRVVSDVGDIKLRVTIVERQMALSERLLGDLKADEQSHYAVVMSRFDSLERRVDRIERRLDLAEASPA